MLEFIDVDPGELHVPPSRPLIANVAGWADQDIWDVEDEQLFQSARRHLEQREAPTVQTDRRA